MNTKILRASTVLVLLIAALSAAAQGAPAIQDRFADVNGVKLHYLLAGSGDPVILLHGYAQNSHMWRPLMVELAKTRTVIAPDMRGFGQSSRPEGGYVISRFAGAMESDARDRASGSLDSSDEPAARHHQ